MRPLTEQETRSLFEKLAKYIGKNIVHLIESKDGQEPHCFRLHKDKIYYVPQNIMLRATNVGRKELMSLGTCMGKLSPKTGKFNMQIGALQVIAPHALHRVWLKVQGEMPFLYGNHVIKAHLQKITSGGGNGGGASAEIPQGSGVVIYAHDGETPLGFGVFAKSSIDCQRVDPTGIVVFHQADVGEYLREEETLF
ncbi:hypothetical protein MP228_007672 [Amoeboaphelidium protococcarum]|nr:hypothetical protein MP228_007672 [Amoeboaphelidium protococcarum]